VSRKGESITLSIKECDKANLEAIASELGMTWGDRPNISKLVEAIARKQIQISKNNDWANDRISDSFKQGFDTLPCHRKVNDTYDNSHPPTKQEFETVLRTSDILIAITNYVYRISIPFGTATRFDGKANHHNKPHITELVRTSYLPLGAATSPVTFHH